MRTLARLSLFASSLIAVLLSAGALAAPFTPGNVVVYRAGDGTAALTGNATAIFLDEYTPAGSFVQSIPMPTTVSGANKRLVGSGNSTTEGFLSRSANGNYLVVHGYDTAVGTTTITTSLASAINRVVGRVDASGSVDTTTAIADNINLGNPRSVSSTDGIDIWVTSSQTGIRYVSFGATSSQQIAATPTNLRGTGVFGGQLYVGSAAGSVRVATVGSGTPTTAGQTITALPGVSASAGVTHFALADLSGAVAGVDTLYICDETGGTGVTKYSLVTGVWTSNGTVTGPCRGLTISVSGTTVTIFTTTTATTNAIQTITDSSGYNAAFTGSLTTIATAGTNTAFRGVALAPIAATPDLTLAVSGPANALAGVNYDYTLTVANSGSAASGVTVDFSLPGGVSFVSASGSSFSASETGGIVHFTGGSVAASGQVVLTVTVTAAAPGMVSVPPGSGIADVGNTIAESNEGNNATTQVVNTTVADPNPDLTVSISGPANAVVSTNYDYTISVGNGGGSSASSVRVDFALPSGVTYVGGTGGGGFSAALNGSTVEFTGGTVGTGSPVVLTVTVTAPAAPTTVTVSPGTVVADPASAIVEVSEANNASTETVNTTIIAATQPDLTVSISGPPTATTYTNYDYSITVANGGTVAATPTRVDFALPVGVTYVGAATAGGFSAVLSGGTVQFTGGNVAGTGNVVLTVTVRVQGSPTTVNVNAGAVVADPAFAIAESDEGNNASTTTVSTVVSDPANLKKIHEVQGNTATSPLATQTVTIDGIVTGRFPGMGGFFVQEEDIDADADPLTSEGIFVFNPAPVTAGDRVRITGTVVEFVSTGITVTEISPATLIIGISGGNPLPTAATVTLPVASITDLERYEGMRVTFTQQLTVTDTFDLGHFGEVTLSANGRLIQPTNVIDPNDVVASGTNSTTNPGNTNVQAVTDAQSLNTRSSILIEDGSTASFPATIQFWDNTQNTLRLGSTADNLTGVMHHAFGSYRVLPQAITWTFAQRPLTPPPVGAANVKVAGMNTLNYFNGDGLGGGFPTSRGANTLAEFSRQRAKTIQAIHQLGADIVGLMEMENDGNGPNSAIQDLVNGLNLAAGTPTWAAINDPVGYGGFIGGTDEIRPAIIYKTAVVAPIGASMAPNVAAFNQARAPVAQTFQVTATGQKVTVVANHFKSKGSGGSGLDGDQNDGQGFFNNARKNQATALLAFVNGTVIPTAGDPKVILLGDFNAYEEEDPMDILRAGGYTALASGITSYSFDGQSGALDHVLVSAALLPRVTGADKWHINADEPTVIDYNVENKNVAGCPTAPCTQPDFYTTDPFRVSDHDPVLVGLFLAAAPTAPQNLQGTPGNAQIVFTWQAPASDGGSPITDYVGECSDGGPFFGAFGVSAPTLTGTASGLTNGVTYSCRVTAQNAIGPGPASTVVTGLTPSTVPGAPTNVQGTAGNAQIVLTYLAPASNGGSAITGYSASCTDGGSNTGSGNSVGTGLTITVSSLVNGVTYSCTVTAANANGPGAASTAATSLTPSTIPDAPTNVQGTAGNAQIVLTYLAPAFNGGAAITGYSASCTDGGSNTGSGNSVGAGLTITVSSLVNGVTYSCTVTAANANGPGAASTAATGLTPSTVPDPPTGINVTAGNASASFTYTAPASNGGSPITGYSVSCTGGSGATGNSAGAALLIALSSLINGTAYSCTFTANNVNGSSPPSAVVNFTPSTVPDAPTSVQATAGDAQATITYLAPASNGGSALTGYTATCTGGSGATGNSVGTGLTITLGGLTNGTTYTCTVVAKNANGSSVPSGSVMVTPQQSLFVLTVTRTGTGTGTVTSVPAGINCGSTCVGSFANGASVVLTATPAGGSAIGSWTGCDSAAGNQCTVAMTSDRSPTVSFATTTTYNVVLEGWQQSPYVVTAGTGSATATFNPANNELTVDLSYSGLSSAETMAHIHGPAARGVNAGVLIDLFPPTTSPRTMPPVTLTPTQVTQLQAGQLYINVHTVNFGAGEIRGQIDNLGATVTRLLNVTVTSTGFGATGSVSGTTEAGTVIACGTSGLGTDCTETIPNGKVVTLMATPTGGSTFAGWSGGGCSGTGTCLVTMDAAKTVIANFDPAATGSSVDLSITQSANLNPATQGKDVIFTLTVTNNGPAASGGAIALNQIAAGTTYVWASPGCLQLPTVVSCNAGSMAVGATVIFKVVLRPTVAAAFTNTVSVSGPGGMDPTSANNTNSLGVNVNAPPVATAVQRYRLYSDVTKEHHFTTDLNEYNTLGTYIGTWVQEGTVGKVLDNPGSFGGVQAVPYYRLYDTNTRWHHWTTDANEFYTLGFVYSGWTMEGVDGYILPTQAVGTTQLYRLNYPYLGSLHHWTIDVNEYNTLITTYGWVGEGGSGFVIQ